MSIARRSAARHRCLPLPPPLWAGRRTQRFGQPVLVYGGRPRGQHLSILLRRIVFRQQQQLRSRHRIADHVRRSLQLGSGGTTATTVGSHGTLPQTQQRRQCSAISGEYGSASEGILQLSANGQYLTMMGYGVNANAFNTAPLSTYGTTAALGQTTSLTTAEQAAQSPATIYTTVPRVVALIGGDGSVDTTTALTGVFNDQQPAQRGDGEWLVVLCLRSGRNRRRHRRRVLRVQGRDHRDADQRQHLDTRAVANHRQPATGTETRAVEIVHTGTDNACTSHATSRRRARPTTPRTSARLTDATGGLPTSATGFRGDPAHSAGGSTRSGGNTGSINLTNRRPQTACNNTPRIGKVRLSRARSSSFSPTRPRLYVTDSGSAQERQCERRRLGEGGLQKWSLIGGVWDLDYDLSAGLNLVNNANANANTPTAPGVTGLFGLTGEVVGNNVELFADQLRAERVVALLPLRDHRHARRHHDLPGRAARSFTTLYSAPSDVSIRGVSFAPAPEPASLAVLATGLAGLGLLRRRNMKA